MRAGTVCFLAALLIDAAQCLWLAGHFDTVLPASLNDSFYFAALYGFLLAWIYGFGHRFVSLFLGVGAPVRGTTEAALAAQMTGVTLALASWLPVLPDSAALALRDAGARAGGPLGPRLPRRKRLSLEAPRLPDASHSRGADGGHPDRLRVARRSGRVLELTGVVLSRTTPLPAQNLWWADAARHAFTIGFLTLLIVGMSFRILPVFSGKPLWSPRLAHATYGLLLLGASMRLLQYPAAFHPVCYRIGSYMGIPVVLALCLFVFNLIRTMRAKPAPNGRRRTPAAAVFASTLPVR